MKTVKDENGVIINTGVLRRKDVMGKRAFCPACGRFIFQTWAWGWDGHAAGTCAGLEEKEPRLRKAEFKSRFRHLFD